MWLTMMIAHYEGAVAMADEAGSSPIPEVGAPTDDISLTISRQSRR